MNRHPLRTTVALVISGIAVLGLSGPAFAGQAQLHFTDASGTERTGTIADIAYLNAPCQDTAQAVDTGSAVQVEVAAPGQHREPFGAVNSDGTWIGLFGDPPAPCLLRAEIASALEHARPQASPTAPWLAMIISMGAIALAVLLVVLWGAGRGPEPTLTAAQGGQGHPEHGDHAHSDPQADAAPDPREQAPAPAQDDPPDPRP